MSVEALRSERIVAIDKALCGVAPAGLDPVFLTSSPRDPVPATRSCARYATR